jgi:hypothetical protein
MMLCLVLQLVLGEREPYQDYLYGDIKLFPSCDVLLHNWDQFLWLVHRFVSLLDISPFFLKFLKQIPFQYNLFSLFPSLCFST